MSKDLLQLKALEQQARGAMDVDVDAEHNPDVSRRASLADLRRQAAQQGAATGTTKMPHFDRIQAAFGGHDISGIQAHVDPRSADAVGAQAYATGNDVVFGQEPDLHTAAHEAAHVVQQRAGVQLYGGIGEAGDQYEKNADAVADRVVAGKSAEHLLGAPRNNAAPTGGNIQRKDKAEKAPDHKADHDASNQQSFEAAMASLQLLATRFHAGAAKLKEGLAYPAGPAQEQFLSSIDPHFERMYAAADHTLSVLGYDLDQTRQSLLTQDIAKVVGGFDVWAGYMQQADQRAQAHGFTTNRNINWVKQGIESYAAKVGLTPKEIRSDRSAPAQDLDAATQSALHEQMEAAMAAVTSTKSDGSSTDSVRARKHLQEVVWLARTMPGSLHKKDKQLVKMKQAIREMEATHPGMKDDLESALHELDKLAK
jgi:hypothetical protein